MAEIEDVARWDGVSVISASKAINGRHRKISTETMDRVEKQSRIRITRQVQ